MKYLLILLLSTTALAKEVTYAVNKNIPNHLKGATITITLANGKTSTVSADKFMVVPRKQYTVVGESSTATKTVTCSAKKNKNLIMLEARKDITELDTEVNGQQAKTIAKKNIIPGLNYYRRDVLDTKFGAGAGADTNGTLKVLVGFDF
jgi:hypothetical protein